MTGASAQHDPALRARNHEALALGLGLRERRGRIGQRTVLQHGQGRDVELVAAEERQQALLLLVGSVIEDRVCERVGRRRGDRETEVAEAELFEHDRVGDGGALLAASTELFGDLCVGETQLPDGVQEVLRNLERFVAVSADRPHRLDGELAQCVSDELLLFRQAK